MNKARDGAAPREATFRLSIGLESRLLSLNTIRGGGIPGEVFRADADDSCSIPQQGRRQECLFEAGDGLAPTGSFKVRGAFWALAQRMKRGPIREVVACSTGNHGAAVAFAAKQFGIAARIFLPANCNPVKRGASQGWGGHCGER